MDCYIDFSDKSIAEFFPDFDGEAYFENVSQHEHIEKDEGGFRLGNTPGSRKAELVFAFQLPFDIVRADIRTSPRIFNDYLRLNRIEALYSTDDEHYQRFYKIISNGNTRYGRYHLPGRGGDRDRRPEWAGSEEYATYDIVYPNGKNLYVKFLLNNNGDHDAQLLSFNKTMFFRLFLDTSGLTKPTIQDNTIVSVETDSDDEVLLYLTFTAKSAEGGVK
jgi:hypothetical protein